MMALNTRVTALVPAYQAAEFILPTLDSLSQQTRAGFDVIISVDLCEDETYAICRDYCADHPGFRVVRQEKRLGYVGNCNYLLSQADADYVLFAFHDDLLAPEYVEKLCRVLDERPEVVMCYSDMVVTELDGKQVHWQYKVMDGVSDRVTRGRYVLNRKGFWWVPNRGVFRLERSRRINGLKTHAGGEFTTDWPWLFHMSLLGEFVRVPEPLCFKQYQAGSLSKTWDFTPGQWYDVSLACMRELLSSELTLLEKVRLGKLFVRKLIKRRKERGGRNT